MDYEHSGAMLMTRPGGTFGINWSNTSMSIGEQHDAHRDYTEPGGVVPVLRSLVRTAFATANLL